jgi:hypothetical protein
MLFLGQSHNVVQHGPLRVWPENGLIRIEDARNNSYKTVPVREFLERVQAIVEMLGNSTDRGIERYFATREYYQRLVEKYIDICRIAREQGTPDDPTARRAAKLARRVSVAVPSSYRMKEL